MLQPAQNLPLPDDLKQFARELRARSTDAESLLWSVVRARRLLGLKFRRQHPIERYIIAYYCEDLSWAIELDGGGHNTAESRRYDAERSACLARHGITVTRYWNHEVLADFETVMESMYRTAMKLKGV